jgi:polyisoprenoid-binding protein YceI
VNTELSAGEWTLDTTVTSIGFQAKAAFGMKVNGRFDRYESAITVGRSVADSAVSASIWTDSVDTGIKMRDEHLRADNVFATARFPTLEFRSTVLVETPTGLNITGTLTSASRLPSTRRGRPHWDGLATTPRWSSHLRSTGSPGWAPPSRSRSSSTSP